MMKKHKRLILLNILLTGVLLAGCGHGNVVAVPESSAEAEEMQKETANDDQGQEIEKETLLEEDETVKEEAAPEQDLRIPVKAKGVYVSAYVAGAPELMDKMIAELDRTEANAVVIDFKDDYGRVVCEVESELIQDIGAVKVYIEDVASLMQKLEEHDIYVIARIPAFRDAWLGEARPDWCLKKADGTVFKDRDGNAWVNPYKKEAWDYLVEVASQAGALGFDEVQFDYVRFCTEKGMREVVFDEADVQGRSKTDIICEFVEYAYERLKEQGLFVSADVFGAIINSSEDANAVGQIYGELAKHLDYISPMIYPSHYGDGNYGIEHPDLQPYELIKAALLDSGKELYFAGQESEHIAQVRPWLQDFTATWLKHHIKYGPEQIRAQIQAAYDAGYDEWLLWDATCRYEWTGLLSPEAAAEEARSIAESRAAGPEMTWAEEEVETATGSDAF